MEANSKQRRVHDLTAHLQFLPRRAPAAKLAEYDVAEVRGTEDAVNTELHLHHLYRLLLEVGHLRLIIFCIHSSLHFTLIKDQSSDTV